MGASSWRPPKRWPVREPKVDEQSVGMSFVAVLFALVVAKVLEPFASFPDLSGPQVSHLLVAGVLTLTSWIGYHNSLNRPRYFIRFPNLPLLQFLLDIAMVVVYWLVASTAEVRSGNPSSRPEATLVLIAFFLYIAWDGVGYLIRRDERYQRRVLVMDSPRRRAVTWWAAGVAVLFVALAWSVGESARTAYLVDFGLVLLLVGFRLAKEWVSSDQHSDDSSAT